jgi:hypothetical protein
MASNMKKLGMLRIKKIRSLKTISALFWCKKLRATSSQRESYLSVKRR